MKRKKKDSFTLFVILLLALILTLLGMLLAGMKEEKRQFTVLLPLGDLAYDEDFLQKAKKIKGIKEIWPVIEVPVVIKIEDYTETTTFSGIDLRYSLLQEYMCSTDAWGLRPLRCGGNVVQISSKY